MAVRHEHAAVPALIQLLKEKERPVALRDQAIGALVELFRRYAADPSVKREDKADASYRAALILEKMKQPEDKLPKIVDHRFEGTEGPVRKQGGPQCTAFAFTSALDHAYARWTGKPAEFSVMQVWARYRQLQEKALSELQR